MIENTELIIKGNKLIQRKTLDLPLEDSENIFKQFIHRQQIPQYSPCPTTVWNDLPIGIDSAIVEKSYVLSKDFNEGYGAVHKIRHFPINGVYGFKVKDEHETEYMPRSYYFGYDELVDYEACAVHCITGHGQESDTQHLQILQQSYPNNFVLFPNNRVLWSDPRFDLFLANFTPENDKVFFFVIEKEYIESTGREDLKDFPRYCPLSVALPNIYDTGQVCMGNDYDDNPSVFSKHERQENIIKTFVQTNSNRDLDGPGTYPNLTFNVRGQPIPLHNQTMFKDSYDDTWLSARSPFRSVTNSFILQFSELYTNGTLL